MKVFKGISDFICSKKTVLTLGTFDGVHVGHQKIIDKVTNNTLNDEFESLVLTFFPHPRKVLQGQTDVKLLNTLAEKIELLKQFGVQNLVIHPFDAVFSNLCAEDFVKKVLVDQFHIHKIIIGHDHRFGKNRTANINDLITFGKLYHFEVEQISVEEIKDVSISSTKIRRALIEGNITLANAYLGYEYFLSGVVQKGRQLGRTIGFPTANLLIKEIDKLIPKNGVYAVRSVIDQQVVFGMMNIGYNPTVSGENLSIEIHYFDFDADLYNKEIRVTMLKFIRHEQKFPSISLLKQQLDKDKESILFYFNSSQPLI